MGAYTLGWALFGGLLALPIAVVAWVVARGGGQLYPDDPPERAIPLVDPGTTQPEYDALFAQITDCPITEQLRNR